jgi:hypothetical protein
MLPQLFTRSGAEAWRAQATPALPASPPAPPTPAVATAALVERQLWKMLLSMAALLAAAAAVGHQW